MLPRKNCKIEGCSNPAWSGGLCKNHIPKKALKKKAVSAIEKMKPYQDEMNRAHLMHTFFLHIWRRRPHRSEISGTPLGKEPLSTFFHHILPKSKYPDAAFDPENIILLTPDEHNNVENDMYKYEEVNKRRETLMRKYDLI
jgi:hypothetical protein